MEASQSSGRSVKTSTEALQKQHGEPIRMLPEDWTSVMVQFETKYGTNQQEEELQAQAYFEEFQEKLAAGMLHAEPLDQTISEAEAEDQDRKKPESRQNGIHLKRFLNDPNEAKVHEHSPCKPRGPTCQVRGPLQLLAARPAEATGKSIVLGLGHNDLRTDPEGAPQKKNFAFKKELDGKPLVAPPWSHCLSYEYEPRREACKKCREQTTGISAVWWDSEHRMRTGFSWSAWPTPHQQPQTRRWRTWCKERSQRSSGTAVLTEAALRATGNRATISQIPKVVDEVARDARSLEPHSSLPCRMPPRRQTPRARRGQRAKARGQANAHQQAPYGLYATSPGGGTDVQDMLHRNKATVSASLFKKAIVKSVHRAPGNTSALDVGEPVGTISASACRPGWRHLTEPQRHRLLSVKLHRPSLSRLSLS